MTQDSKDSRHWTADEGKTFRRIEDQFIMGPDMFLGLYIDGTQDVIENYEEIDDPEKQSDDSDNENIER